MFKHFNGFKQFQNFEHNLFGHRSFCSASCLEALLDFATGFGFASTLVRVFVLPFLKQTAARRKALLAFFLFSCFCRRRSLIWFFSLMRSSSSCSFKSDMSLSGFAIKSIVAELDILLVKFLSCSSSTRSTAGQPSPLGKREHFPHGSSSVRGEDESNDPLNPLGIIFLGDAEYHISLLVQVGMPHYADRGVP